MTKYYIVNICSLSSPIYIWGRTLQISLFNTTSE